MGEGDLPLDRFGLLLLLVDGNGAERVLFPEPGLVWQVPLLCVSRVQCISIFKGPATHRLAHHDDQRSQLFQLRHRVRVVVEQTLSGFGEVLRKALVSRASTVYGRSSFAWPKVRVQVKSVPKTQNIGSPVMKLTI